MAGNQEVVVQMVSAEALRIFTNTCVMPRYIKRDFEKYYEGKVKIGSSMSIKRPIRSVGADGQAFQPEGVVRVTVPFSISYWNQEAWLYNDTEWAMYLDDNWREMYLKPKIVNLANKVDRYMMNYMTSTIPNFVGTPGTVPTTLNTYNSAQTKLDQLLAPQNDRVIVYNSSYNQNIVSASQTLFNPGQIVGRQYLEGKVGRYANFDIMKDEQIPTFNIGTFSGAITVTGAGQTGASLLVGATPGSLSLSPGPVGVDRITIDGVYEVNQYSRTAISGISGPVLKQFAVVQPVADVAGAATLTLFPAMITSGPYQNCSGSPAAGAAVHVQGTTGQVGVQTAFALQEDAFTWAAIRLQNVDAYGASCKVITDEQTGISLRVVIQFDIRTGQVLMRVDFIWGIAQLYADYDAAVIYG